MKTKTKNEKKTVGVFSVINNNDNIIFLLF